MNPHQSPEVRSTHPSAPRLEKIRLDQLARLRESIFAGNNHFCFVEREKLLPLLAEESKSVSGELRYSWVLTRLLERVSMPVDDDDVFLGRMVEGSTGMPDELVEDTPWQRICHQEMLITPGHMALDWEELLREGLSGVACKARATAERLASPQATLLATNAALCAEAVRHFAHRYAREARRRAAFPFRGVASVRLYRARPSALRWGPALCSTRAPFHGPGHDRRLPDDHQASGIR